VLSPNRIPVATRLQARNLNHKKHQKTCFRTEKLTALNSLNSLAPCLTPPAPIPGPSCCIISCEERWHTLELKKYAGFQASWIVIRRSLNELVMAWCFAFKYLCLVIGVLLFTLMTQLVHEFQHYQLPEKLVANRNPIFKNWKGQMLLHEKSLSHPFLLNPSRQLGNSSAWWFGMPTDPSIGLGVTTCRDWRRTICLDWSVWASGGPWVWGNRTQSADTTPDDLNAD